MTGRAANTTIDPTRSRCDQSGSRNFWIAFMVFPTVIQCMARKNGFGSTRVFSKPRPMETLAEIHESAFLEDVLE